MITRQGLNSTHLRIHLGGITLRYVDNHARIANPEGELCSGVTISNEKCINVQVMADQKIFWMSLVGPEKIKPTINVGFEMALCPEQDSNLHIRVNTSP